MSGAQRGPVVDHVHPEDWQSAWPGTTELRDHMHAQHGWVQPDRQDVEGPAVRKMHDGHHRQLEPLWELTGRTPCGASHRMGIGGDVLCDLPQGHPIDITVRIPGHDAGRDAYHQDHASRADKVCWRETYTARKPRDWAERKGIRIKDRDGWRNETDQYPAQAFSKAISEREFDARAAVSTVEVLTCQHCDHAHQPGTVCKAVTGWSAPLPGSPDYRSTAYVCECTGVPTTTSPTTEEKPMAYPKPLPPGTHIHTISLGERALRAHMADAHGFSDTASEAADEERLRGQHADDHEQRNKPYRFVPEPEETTMPVVCGAVSHDGLHHCNLAQGHTVPIQVTLQGVTLSCDHADLDDKLAWYGSEEPTELERVTAERDRLLARVPELEELLNVERAKGEPVRKHLLGWATEKGVRLLERDPKGWQTFVTPGYPAARGYKTQISEEEFYARLAESEFEMVSYVGGPVDTDDQPMALTIEQLRTELSRTIHERNVARQSRLLAMEERQEALDQRDRQVAALKGDRQVARSERDAALADVTRLTGNLEAAERALEARGVQLAEAREESSTLSRRAAAVCGELTAARDSMKTERDMAVERNSELARQGVEKNTKVIHAERAQAELREHLQQALDQRNEALSQGETLTAERDRAIEEAVRQTEQRNRMRKALEDARESLVEMRPEIAQLVKPADAVWDFLDWAHQRGYDLAMTWPVGPEQLATAVAGKGSDAERAAVDGWHWARHGQWAHAEGQKAMQAPEEGEETIKPEPTVLRAPRDLLVKAKHIDIPVEETMTEAEPTCPSCGGTRLRHDTFSGAETIERTVCMSCAWTSQLTKVEETTEAEPVSEGPGVQLEYETCLRCDEPCVRAAGQEAWVHTDPETDRHHAVGVTTRG